MEKTTQRLLRLTIIVTLFSLLIHGCEVLEKDVGAGSDIIKVDIVRVNGIPILDSVPVKQK